MKKQYAWIHKKAHPGMVDDFFKVRILARAEGYAMVRRPWAVPFVTKESELVNNPEDVFNNGE